MSQISLLNTTIILIAGNIPIIISLIITNQCPACWSPSPPSAPSALSASFILVTNLSLSIGFGHLAATTAFTVYLQGVVHSLDFTNVLDNCFTWLDKKNTLKVLMSATSWWLLLAASYISPPIHKMLKFRSWVRQIVILKSLEYRHRDHHGNENICFQKILNATWLHGQNNRNLTCLYSHSGSINGCAMQAWL